MTKQGLRDAKVYARIWRASNGVANRWVRWTRT